MTISLSESAAHWERIGIRPHHGLCLPLFSLRSHTSSGIGEFSDLLPLISFCREVGFDLIQLLPLNDTGGEPSPYSALSAYALHPIYLSLHKLPHLDESADLGSFAKLNALDRLAYHEVRKQKMAFLRSYFERVYPLFAKQPAYLSFQEENRLWLEPYALFCTLKEFHKEANWESWPSIYNSPETPQSRFILQERHEEIAFHTFLQFLCFQQWQEVRTHAERSGLFLKGDLPFLINRDSCDIWAHKELFQLNLMAGSPPDMYSKEGQEWGFPIYNWEAMERAGYGWWKQRLAVAERLYHLYRLDHIVGFFRIWAIPLGRPGKEGYFLPKEKERWLAQGTELVKMMLHSTTMLPIGEDLGTVPPEVRVALTSLGIPGTKVPRWERRWEEDKSYIDPKEYGPISMTTVSTHDSETLDLWWRGHPDEAKLFGEVRGWKVESELTRMQRFEILRESHHSGSLFHVNLFNEYLALFPELIHRDPEEERINLPGKILETNWSYRFRPFLEAILSHSPLKDALRELLAL